MKTFLNQFIPMLAIALVGCATHPDTTEGEAGAPALLQDSQPQPHLGQTLWLRRELESLQSEIKLSGNDSEERMKPIGHWLRLREKIQSWSDFPTENWREDLQEDLIQSEASIRNHVITTIDLDLKHGHTWATLRLVKQFQTPPLVRSPKIPGLGPSYERTLAQGRRECEVLMKEVTTSPKAELYFQLMSRYCLAFDPPRKERFERLSAKRLVTLYRASQFTRIGEFESKYDGNGLKSTVLGEALQASLRKSPWFDLQAEGVMYLMVNLGTDSKDPIWKGQANLLPVHDLLRWEVRRADFPETQQLNAFTDALENQLNLQWIKHYCPEKQPTRVSKAMLVDSALRCVRIAIPLRPNWAEPVCRNQFGMGCEETLGTLNIAAK